MGIKKHEKHWDRRHLKQILGGLVALSVITLFMYLSGKYLQTWIFGSNYPNPGIWRTGFTCIVLLAISTFFLWVLIRCIKWLINYVYHNGDTDEPKE